MFLLIAVSPGSHSGRPYSGGCSGVGVSVVPSWSIAMGRGGDGLFVIWVISCRAG
jgi:uncharacterized membrane protein